MTIQAPAGWNVPGTGVAGLAVSVIKPPPALPKNRHILYGVDVSFSAAPAAAVLAQVLDWGATVASIAALAATVPSVASTASMLSVPSFPTAASVASASNPAIWEAYVPVTGAAFRFPAGIASGTQGFAMALVIAAPGGSVVPKIELQGATTS